jgi:hypothetical protein
MWLYTAPEIDFATPMLSEDGKPLKELFVDDDLHLNSRVYELWTSIVRAYLAEVCVNGPPWRERYYRPEMSSNSAMSHSRHASSNIAWARSR